MHIAAKRKKIQRFVVVDVLLLSTFWCVDVLSHRRFVFRRFVCAPFLQYIYALISFVKKMYKTTTKQATIIQPKTNKLLSSS
jgi:hypothetical protein